MAKNLVIVESPAKAKTIEGFLGEDYTVMSSFGHVRDLEKNKLSVDLENGFRPDYIISPDKKKVVTALKKKAKQSEKVLLASDEDREGEAISWHLVEALNLDLNKTERIVFHEITKNAIKNAIENPRSIDYNLVNAQQARRVLDRLVGYELSPLLWKKVKPSLSAGRVQSVAVRLIVEREDEIRNFKPESHLKVTADFDAKGKVLSAELSKKLADRNKARELLEHCQTADFVVSKVEKKPGKKSPAPPFTTSTLQQEASRKLGYSVAKTMMVAQKLYESGQITYMRTDSVNLSGMALGMTKDEIFSEFGEDYHQTRNYTTRSKGAQEAHEAIRPTYINKRAAKGDNSMKKLYELIWKRTIASQMSDAKLEKTNVYIDISERNEKFIGRGEVITFDGFLKVYLESTDDEDNAEEQKGMLPPINKGENMHPQTIDAIQRFSKHPPRYTEASLVKKMEELGIGRPSTFAPTISTIQKREYIVKEDRDGVERKYLHINLKNNKISEDQKSEKTGYEKGKLFPTDIGILVNKFLISYFKDIMDYGFTAQVEEKFDRIADGQEQWNKMIEDFYGSFHEKVKETEKKAERFRGERLLGKDPKSKKNVYAKIGRYGPMIQIGDTESDEKPRFAGLRKNQSLQTISLEEALELFQFPKSIGEYENEELVVSIGRFGPYVRHKSKFYSIPKDEEPVDVTKERAVEIIEAKRKHDRERTIKEFPQDDQIRILKGRYGPYISMGRTNYRIPKDKDPERLTYEDCMQIIETSGKTSRKTSDKKTASKKSATQKTSAKKGGTKTKKTSSTKKKSSGKNS
ncbi:MAG: type I DNA topoisomerase [Bacteroidales bacterium]|nr:type I DNA topoisomerase [Bacteroidales bacterium]